MLGLNPVRNYDSFGIFVNDVQMAVKSGKFSWKSEKDAKLALVGHFKHYLAYYSNWEIYNKGQDWAEFCEVLKEWKRTLIVFRKKDDKEFWMYFEEGELILICASKKELYENLYKAIEIRKL